MEKESVYRTLVEKSLAELVDYAYVTR